MRNRALLALAALPLIGAAPPLAGTPGEAAECKLSYPDAQKSLEQTNITRSSGEDPAAKGGFIQYFNPAGITVLGKIATGYSRAEFESDGVRRILFRVQIAASYAETRAAMLKLHSRKSCDAYESTDPGSPGCMIHVRDEDGTPGHDVDMILFEADGAITTGCVYATKPEGRSA